MIPIRVTNKVRPKSRLIMIIIERNKDNREIVEIDNKEYVIAYERGRTTLYDNGKY